ncbi:MAG: 4-hydroxythreonine-4-phosphate dehydrogenase PdxA [Proteobacteria bacterium]|nr:4-hydroxythreonine-4-phosphate dehydrogenase PdxA [Pseudomonadota bacterium]
MAIARLALTTGEPAGIGPDICLKLANYALPAEVVLIGSLALLKERAKALDINVDFYAFDAKSAPKTNGQNRLAVVDVALHAPCIPGELNIANSKYVLSVLKTAYSLCANGQTNALVTAPIHKAIIQLSGIPFSGHTEYFAQLANVQHVLMTFFTPELIVAMATTHCPLNKVSELLTKERLENAIRLLHQGLTHVFKMNAPIRVLGLNPHAGESGQIGEEEQILMAPVIKSLKAQGINVEGPISGDTAFTPDNRKKAGAILAMYHDQGLAPIKALYFGEIVNVTLGLPFLRTSVDHGCALELAGTPLAQEASLLKAIDVAVKYGTNLKVPTFA